MSYPQKVDALTRILEVENFEGMIVFVRTKNETETLAEKLRARGFSAMAINGDVAAGAARAHRQPAQDGKLDILVATDVAARGLDVERISHVVNYDIPHRHRVLRPPHRPHRPRGPHAATRSRSSPRASATCCAPSRRPPASR